MTSAPPRPVSWARSRLQDLFSPGHRVSPQRTPQLSAFVDLVDAAVPDHAGDVTLREGTWPENLRLTLFAGGLFRSAARRIPHLLDAYSSMIRVRLGPDGGDVLCRALPDPLREAETDAGRILRKGFYTGTRGQRPLVSGLAGRTALHDVRWWAGRLYGTSAGGGVELCPETLEPVTPLLPPVSSFAGQHHGLHPKIDPVSGRMLNIHYRLSPTLGTAIDFLELDADGTVSRVPYRHPDVLTVHAYTFSANHHILIDRKVSVSKLPFLLGLNDGAFDGMDDVPGSLLRVHVAPRTPERPPFEVQVPVPGHAYHVTNAYEEDGHLVVDAYCSVLDPRREASQFDLTCERQVWTSSGGFRRIVIDLQTHETTVERLLPEIHQVTFDSLDERFRGTAHRHLWTVANDQHERGRSEVVHGDLATGRVQRWTTDERWFLREAQFVASGAAEGEGWLVVPTWTPDETRWLLFDAQRVADGPVAQVGADVVLPYGVHATAAPHHDLSA